MSFTDFGLRNVTRPWEAEFIGFENYVELFGDEKFLTSLFNTGYFVVVGVPLTIGIGLVVAVLLNNGIDRARTFFRVGFYAPVVTTIVRGGLVVWRFVLDPSDGLIAGLFSEVGWTAPDFLGSETLAMPSLIVMAVWRNVGTVMVLFIAGLQAIPAEVREGGEAGRCERLARVPVHHDPAAAPDGPLRHGDHDDRLPQRVRGTVGDDPGRTVPAPTLTVSLNMYREGFNFFHMGYASAMAYVLFVVIMGITVLQLRLLKDNTK
ncbi:sugar ABC transporter permease [Streptomyces tanashiensis]